MKKSAKKGSKKASKKISKKSSKKSSILSVHRMIWKKPKDMLFTMLFDLCFMAFLLILFKVWNSIIPAQEKRPYAV